MIALSVGVGIALVAAFGALWTVIETTDGDPPLGWYAIALPALSGIVAALSWSRSRWEHGEAFVSAVGQAALTVVVYCALEPVLGVIPSFDQSTMDRGERIGLAVLMLVPSVAVAAVVLIALRVVSRMVTDAGR